MRTWTCAGGSEEIILSQRGRERLFILNRKVRDLSTMQVDDIRLTGLRVTPCPNMQGFIKMALRFGYTIIIGYTFGESDSYSTMKAFEKGRMKILKKYKVPMFLPCGTWYCPLLPRRDTALETVIGNAIKLPKVCGCG
jgi:hypothetical protein